MAYNHGVKISEVPTSILPPVEVSAGIPFIVGTAPINMTDPSNVNKPILCYNYAEAVAAFGYVPPKTDVACGLKKYEYTISEFIQSQFALFGVAPVIVVNVLDPTKHKKSADALGVTLDVKTGSVTVEETGILLDSVSLSGDGVAYSKDVDYVLAFDDDGNLVITSMTDEDGGFLCQTGVSLTFSADKLDPTLVTDEDIVGGVSADGSKRGLELINECFPRFRLVPGIVLAPGYSGDATVAAVMAAKCANINEVFRAICLIDVPTSVVTQYGDVAVWKNTNNVVDPSQVACWPMLALDDVVYHQSTQLAALIGQVDGNNDDVPYVSPSNKRYQMTSAVIEDGTEVWLGLENAAYLNGQGVVTAINFSGGWVCWGNRTAAYPSTTDVKDSFISIRRMFCWVGNTFVLTYWQRLDYPLNKRQIDTVITSAGVWLNGLTARQYILGGRIVFLGTENSTIDLMEGISRFHVFFTPPSPNREIEFILEYDPEYMQTLFS